MSDLDPIRDAIAKVIADDDHDDQYMVGDFTLIAELIGSDTETYLFPLQSTELTLWKERGMLMHRLDMLSGATTATQIEKRENET